MGAQAATWTFLLVWLILYWGSPPNFKATHGRRNTALASGIWAMVAVLIGVLIILVYRALRGDFG